jgi:cell shape-determining protein MreC
MAGKDKDAMELNILVIGSGGREHAIVRGLDRFKEASHIYVAPGNGGTLLEPCTENSILDAMDHQAVADFCQAHAIGMAVIGPEGIVGIVYSVSEHFATVMPMINRNFRLSVKFKKNNHFGSLSWDGRSYRHANLNEIGLHVPVANGDTLVVSGFSDSFPEGIPVGVVDKVEQKDGSFYTITVLLATDFRKLHYVSVVEDLMKTEKQYLEQPISDMQ